MFEHLLFDLDNTLYPASAAINNGITSRMRQFVSNYLQLPMKEAVEQRHEGLTRFGTTLEWLMTDYLLDNDGVEAFFAYVHPESEINEVPFDPDLRTFLESLPFQKSILTNAPYEHAERILRMLKIEDLFPIIYDLRANNLHGKPHPDSYLNVITKAGFSVKQTLFLDDHLKYTTGYASLGGKSVLVDYNGIYCESEFDCIKSVYQLPDYLSKFQ